MRKEPASVRFPRLFEKRRRNQCWPWKGATIRGGYGQFHCDDGKKRVAHLVAYELSAGPVPIGSLVCHSCDNPSCVNPKHLFLGSHDKNMQDMKDKLRAVGIKKPSSRVFRYLSDEERKAIVDLLKDGHSIMSIATQLGTSRKTIRNVRDQAGINHEPSKYTPRRLRKAARE